MMDWGGGIFHRRTIFKMLALEQTAKSDLLAPGTGRPTAPTSLATGLRAARVTGRAID